LSRKSKLINYIRNYRLKSIFVRNTALIIILVLIPITVLSYILNKNFDSTQFKESALINLNALTGNRDLLETVIEQNRLLAANLTLHEDIRSFLLFNDSDTFASHVGRVSSVIEQYTLVYDNIDSIYIYSQKNNFVVSKRANEGFELFGDKSWYEISNDTPKNTVDIRLRRRDDSGSYILSACAPVRLNDNYLGAVVVNIKMSALRRMIDGANNSSVQDTYVIDENGRIIYSFNNQLISKPSSEVEALCGIENASPGQAYLVTDKDGKKFCTMLESSKFNWKYVSVMQNVFDQRKNDGAFYYKVFIFLFAFVTGIIISITISIKAFKPIDTIVSVIDKPDRWNENPEGMLRNEIRYIIDNILKTVKTNEQLKNELSDRIGLLNSSHIAILQDQITPHFIYNTLESINWMTVDYLGYENKVSEAVLLLSKLLRACSATHTFMSSVKEELEYTRIYARILRIRFGDMFDIVFNVESETLNLQTIKMSLQPLIENSVYHGIKPKQKRGRIEVRGYISGENLVFEVEDDGVGMTAEVKSGINDTFARAYILKGKNLGLSNLSQRIKLIFGENYSLEIVKSDERGTLIRMTMPKVT